MEDSNSDEEIYNNQSSVLVNKALIKEPIIEPIIEAFNKYYELKSKYENVERKFIQRIAQNTALNNREKKQRIINFRNKCVNCDQKGGTIFSSEKDILKAICGNTSNPCSLNITIDRGQYEPIENIVDDYHIEVNELKENIIKLKMNILFGYKKEDDIISDFETLKEDFELIFTLLQEQQQRLNNIINNSMNKVLIRKQMNEINDFIDQIKLLMVEYNKTSSNSLIGDVISIYIDKLLPLLETNINTKYVINQVIRNEEDDTYHLEQKTYNELDLIYDIKPSSVISFELGNKSTNRKNK